MARMRRSPPARATRRGAGPSTLHMQPNSSTKPIRERISGYRAHLALDYAFVGEEGPAELTGLLCEAARELVETETTHIALFVSDEDPATEWLAQLAEASDVYAICGPPVGDPPPASGPIYADQILF